MVRQYIGARYVPKFYENSQNPLSNDWEANVTYEALTVVTYLSDSYTSKKPVPLTVGNPRDNGEYWALTGAYNAQIENYREIAIDASEKATAAITSVGDIEDLETVNKDNLVNAVNELKFDIDNIDVDIDTWLTNKKVVALGDSLFWADTVEGQIWYYMKQLNPTMTLYNHSLAGRTASDIYTELQTGNCDVDLLNSDVVFVNFGTNEWTLSVFPSVMLTAMNNIISYIRNVNPNIQIVICTPPPQVRDGWNDNKNSRGLTTYDIGVLMRDRAQEKGCTVADMFKMAGFDFSNARGFYTPSEAQSITYYVHPNLKFAKRIAYNFTYGIIDDYKKASITDELFIGAPEGVTIDRKQVMLYPNGMKRITCRVVATQNLASSAPIANISFYGDYAMPQPFVGVKLSGNTYSPIGLMLNSQSFQLLESVTSGTTIYIDKII